MRNGRKNGHANGKVRVAIVGAGNCASSFVQGVHYYRNASTKEFVPGVRVAIVLLNRNNPLHDSIWKESQSAAHALNVNLESACLTGPRRQRSRPRLHPYIGEARPIT